MIGGTLIIVLVSVLVNNKKYDKEGKDARNKAFGLWPCREN